MGVITWKREKVSRKWKDSNSRKGGKLRPQEMDGLLRGAKSRWRNVPALPLPLPSNSGVMQHLEPISNVAVEALNRKRRSLQWEVPGNLPEVRNDCSGKNKAEGSRESAQMI